MSDKVQVSFTREEMTLMISAISFASESDTYRNDDAALERLYFRFQGARLQFDK